MQLRGKVTRGGNTTEGLSSCFAFALGREIWSGGTLSPTQCDSLVTARGGLISEHGAPWRCAGALP